MFFLKIFFSATLMFALFFPTSGSENTIKLFEDLKGKLDIYCAPELMPVLQEAAMEIVKSNSSIKISLNKSSSTKGLDKLKKGQIDLAITDIPVKDSGFKSNFFAINGVAVIVNKDNPAWDMTIEQVRDIFTGKIKNWNKICRLTAQINICSMNKESLNSLLFRKIMLNGEAVSETATRVSSEKGMKILAMADPKAIGYINISLLDDKDKPVRINGQAPSERNVLKGRYKYVCKYYVCTTASPSHLTSQFIKFMLSKKGRSIIGKSNFLLPQKQQQ